MPFPSTWLIFSMAAAVVALGEVYDDVATPTQEEFEEVKCPLNEVWMECSSCEQICGQPLVGCAKVCQPPRCQCPAHKGFKRDSAGKCIFCDK